MLLPHPCQLTKLQKTDEKRIFLNPHCHRILSFYSNRALCLTEFFIFYKILQLKQCSFSFTFLPIQCNVAEQICAYNKEYSFHFPIRLIVSIYSCVFSITLPVSCFCNCLEIKRYCRAFSFLFSNIYARPML